MKGIVKVLLGILKFPLHIIKYFCTGVFLVMYFLISFVVSLLEYMFEGIIVTCKFLRYIIYYFIYGLLTPFLLIVVLIKKQLKKMEPQIEKKRKEKEIEKQKQIEQKEIIKQKKLEEKQHIIEEKRKQREFIIASKEEKQKKKEEEAQNQELIKQQEEEKRRVQEEEIKKAKAFIAEEKARKREEAQREKKILEKEQKDAYINKNLGINKAQTTFIGRFIQRLKNAKTNEKESAYTRRLKRKKDINKPVLLLNFEGEDAKKSEKKILYEYIVKDPKTQNIIKGYSDAYSKVEVHSYLLSEGYEVYSIKTSWWIQLMHSQAGSNKVKFKTKDLIFLITQLSTYLKAGITLVEALRILSKQFKNKNYQRILKAVVYDLTMGTSLSEAMNKQGMAFPKLLINMVKTAEMTGQLPEVLDDMVEYYSEMEQTRKQMITALTYPSLVFVFAVAVITFMLIFVIPQFTDIYTSMDGVEIPKFTQIVISISNFLRSYTLIIFLAFIAFCVVFVLLYQHIRGFKTIVQWALMHIPVIGDTIIYNEVTTFTKTFASLLSHSVFITDSMDILNRITNNEIYKSIIEETITNLSKGDRISAAFEGHWAFPLPAYEMLVTGENTGQLPEMMQKVSTYYQMLHKDSVTRLKTFIEPILTIFLTVIVGAIILAIIIPMFGMYGSIQNY